MNMNEEHTRVLKHLESEMKSMADHIIAQEDCFAQRFTALADLHIRAVNYLSEEQRLMEKRLTSHMQHLSSQQAVSGAEVKTAKIELDRRLALQSLRFSEMFWRQQGIAEAHEATFHWIFKEKWSIQDEITRDEIPLPWDSFYLWLKHHDGIYWMNGKAGSGKSTLMRYICAGGTATEVLKDWASEKQLVVASFFFWNNGSEIQKSQGGLFRSLLHQCLSKMDQIVSPCLGPAKEVVDRVGWSEPVAREAFWRMIQLKPADTKICLFIDGLDEYSGATDKLLATIRRMSILPNVKVCVSSRPWVEFQRAFTNDYQLRLQDLTRGDIGAMAYRKLQCHQRLAEMNKREQWEVEGIARQISDRADGVFLWANIVIQSLWRGLEHEDDVWTLRRRLDAFPSEVNAMYRHMLETLEPVYRDKAHRIFRLIMAAGKESYLLNIMLAQDPDLNAILQRQTQDVVPSDMPRTLLRFARQIQSLSAGFVILQADRDLEQHIRQPRDEEAIRVRFWEVARTTLTFSHRTVEDFLNGLEDGTLNSNKDSTLNAALPPEIALVGSLILNIRMSDTKDEALGRLCLERRMPSDPEEAVLAQLCEQFTRLKVSRQEREHEATLVRVMDELDSTMATKLLRLKAQKLGGSTQYSHWSHILPKPPPDKNNERTLPSTDCFLDFCVECGHTGYVRARSSAFEGPENRQQCLRFMLIAFKQVTWYKSDNREWWHTGPSLELISIFLEAGADPNLSSTGCLSIWDWWVKLLAFPYRMNHPSQYTIDMTALLLKHGAYVNHRVNEEAPLQGTTLKTLEDRGLNFTIAEAVEFTKDTHEWWEHELLLKMRSLLRSYGAICRAVVVEQAPHTGDPWAVRQGQCTHHGVDTLPHRVSINERCGI